MLTIFTPTYNRAYILPKLYESLCSQTCKDFEWVIVDDGSSDDTKELIEGFIAEKNIDIRYIHQENAGKHIAINRGVSEARGELFFIVDSDDHLTADAVEWILNEATPIMTDKAFAGLSGTRITKDGVKIGGLQNYTVIDADAIRIRTVHGITGDLAEIYKTEVMRQFPFPEFPNERFCSEGLIWNRIAMTGLKLRYYNRGIYICEYLSDGLTAGRVKCRRESPEYSLLLYSEAMRNPAYGFKAKLKYGLLFWRYGEKSRQSFFQKAQMVSPLYWSLIIPGILIRCLKR